MVNALICKECGGSKAVANRREHQPIGDTGLERETRIPESSKDIEWLKKVYPPTPPNGYRLAYEWHTIRKNERDVECVSIFMEKCEEYPQQAPKSQKLSAKSKDELVEMAVMAGVSGADGTWSKANLISAINEAGTKAASVG